MIGGTPPPPLGRAQWGWLGLRLPVEGSTGPLGSWSPRTVTPLPWVSLCACAGPYTKGNASMTRRRSTLRTIFLATPLMEKASASRRALGPPL